MSLNEVKKQLIEMNPFFTGKLGDLKNSALYDSERYIETIKKEWEEISEDTNIFLWFVGEYNSEKKEILLIAQDNILTVHENGGGGWNGHWDVNDDLSCSPMNDEGETTILELLSA